MLIFFTCIKKTNQKKVQPITWSNSVGLPEVYTPLRGAARKERETSESRTPCGALRRVAFPFFAVLLGCVKWQKTFTLKNKEEDPFCAAEHRSC
jgi:hypothetical protein